MWSPVRPIALVERLGRVELVDTKEWTTAWRATIDGFAVLAMAFGEDTALVAAAVDGDRGDPAHLVCLHLADGRELWKSAIPSKHSVPAVAWVAERAEWVIWQFDVERRLDALVRMTPEGAIVERHSLDVSGDAAFAGHGRWLVTSDSDVIDTATFARHVLLR